MEPKSKINEGLQKLETIAKWFESQKSLDLEEGLKKLQEGALLIKELKGKLNKVENEFREIQKELENTTDHED